MNLFRASRVDSSSGKNKTDRGTKQITVPYLFTTRTTATSSLLRETKATRAFISFLGNVQQSTRHTIRTLFYNRVYRSNTKNNQPNTLAQAKTKVGPPSFRAHPAMWVNPRLLYLFLPVRPPMLPPVRSDERTHKPRPRGAGGKGHEESQSVAGEHGSVSGGSDGRYRRVS